MERVKIKMLFLILLQRWTGYYERGTVRTSRPAISLGRGLTCTSSQGSLWFSTTTHS